MSVTHKRVLLEKRESTSYIAKCNGKITGDEMSHFWKDVDCKKCLHRKSDPNKVARAVKRMKDDLDKHGPI